MSFATAIYSCAVISGGEVKCWGMNASGELGNGTSRPSSSAVSVNGILDAVLVSGGPITSCVLRSSGKISCWGSNALGQLGNGSTRDSSTPVSVKHISHAIGLAVSTSFDWHTCAILANGNVKCWGSNSMAALGDPSLGLDTEDALYSSVPVDVQGLPVKSASPWNEAL